MKLCFGTKQGVATADALIGSCGFRFLIFAGERRLGSLLPRHIVLILRELPFPGGFVFAYFFSHSSCFRVRFCGGNPLIDALRHWIQPASLTIQPLPGMRALAHAYPA